MKFLVMAFIFYHYSFPVKADDDSSCLKTFQEFGLIGTPVHQGQPHKSVHRAYHHLNQSGFWRHLQIPYRNLGTLPFENTNLIYRQIFHKTLEILNQDLRPALIGGDHSLSFGSISALLQHNPDLKVLWIDAHADINTPETSPSGNIHGMPLAGLIGLAEKEQFHMPWLVQKLQPDNLIYLGLRDIDEGERAFIETYNIENYTPQDIRNTGLKHILSNISEKWKDEKVHLSFDIDSLDSSLVPATGTPVDQGLNLKEALTIINWAKQNLQLSSFEVVEFHPGLAKTKEELKTTERHVQMIIENLLSPVESEVLFH